ncbi:lipopolysaccharide biosynthesis protein [Candidatus Azambacteria bacterium]|nr:lipopolysaccharide biosynthesis protein [Candidatus Azambacteria bacterium]MBI3685621.1 lipopolysaccharide biosynthesis protein [Candidatus Azambacteria bacterium]
MNFKSIRKKAFALWEATEHSGQKVARGSVLVVAERFVIKAVQFVRTVIVARLLFPDDIGLFGMATLAMGVTEAFVQTGFNAAIVQEKGDVRRHLDSAWTVNVIRGIAVALLLLFVIAPLAGGFFANEQVTPLIRALALIVFMGGFENIGIVLLQRELRFGRQVLYDVSGVIVETIGVIVGVIMLKNAWGLVFGSLAGRTAYLVASYALHSYRPRFILDVSGAKYLFGFGKWIGASGIVTFFASSGDNLMAGKLLGASALGFYQIAFALGTLPAVEIGRVLGKVFFPAYARFQEDRERLVSAFFRVSQMVFLITIPASVGLAALAPEIVSFVYSSRWLPMVPALYVIALYGLLKSFDFLVTPLFLAIGKPHVQTFALVIQASVMFLLIIPFTHAYGIVGVAWAATAGLCAAQAMLFWRLRREMPIMNALVFLKLFSVPAAGSAIMAFFVLFSKSIAPPESIFFLLLYIAYGMAVYFGTVFFLDKMSGGKLYESLIWIRKNV